MKGGTITTVRRSLTGLALLLVVALSAGAAPAAAQEQRGITLGFADPRFSSQDPAERESWFERSAESGGDWARVTIGWRGIAPNEPADPTDPASAGYAFAGPDSAVRSAAAQGMPVLFTVSFAPDWAEGPDRPGWVVPGTWKPDPQKLADFATALATRYDGSFPDPLNPGETLPEVTRFEVWNESNLSAFMAPQREDGEEVAPDHYRRMVNAFYEAAHAVQPEAQVVAGSLSPIGSDGNGPKGARVGPLAFLRKLFCVEGRKRPRAVDCGETVELDALSHHPINSSRSARAPAPGSSDAGIAEMDEVTDILRAAEEGGNVATPGEHPVWATEFWWHSNPPKKRSWVPSLKQQAAYIEEALYLLWRERVEVAMLFQVGDQQGSRFATGVTFADGEPKPSQTAYRFPLVGDRKSKSRVRVWGRAPAAGTVRIQVRPKGGTFETARRIEVEPGSVFDTTVRMRGKGKLRARLGDENSLSWDQGGR